MDDAVTLACSAKPGRELTSYHAAQTSTVISAAVAIRREKGGIAEASIGLTNIGATPLRASAAEMALADADAAAAAVAGLRRGGG